MAQVVGTFLVGKLAVVHSMGNTPHQLSEELEKSLPPLAINLSID